MFQEGGKGPVVAWEGKVTLVRDSEECRNFMSPCSVGKCHPSPEKSSQRSTHTQPGCGTE